VLRGATCHAMCHVWCLTRVMFDSCTGVEKVPFEIHLPDKKRILCAILARHVAKIARDATELRC
jgi:hypothetical protein